MNYNTDIACICTSKCSQTESSELSVVLVTDCRLLSHFLVDLLEQKGHGMNSPLTKIRNKLTQDKK